MSNSILCKGEWWLPSNPKKKVHGTLEVDGVATLSLEGAFFRPLTRDEVFQDIIFGDTNQGYVSLFKSTLQSSGYSLRYVHSTYQVQLVLIGKHLESLDTPSFNEIFLQYSNLLDWFEQGKGLKMTRSKKAIKIVDTSLNELTVKVSSDLKLRIKDNTLIQERLTKKIEIDKDISLEAEFAKCKTLSQLLLVERQIRDFFRFAFTKDTSLEKFYIKLPRKESQLPAELIFGLQTSSVNESVGFYDMLFDFIQISSHAKNILVNWFSKYEYFSPVYSLYFNAFYTPNLVIEQTFLNAAQALEAYHRRTKDNFVIPEYDHEQRVEEIRNHTPSIYKSWLSSKLAYSNEPSLKVRLDSIIKDFEEINQVIIDDSKFSHKVVDYRNQFTHYDPNKTGETIDYRDLNKQIFKLRCLLDCCILKELGVPQDLLIRLIRKKYISISHYLNR